MTRQTEVKSNIRDSSGHRFFTSIPNMILDCFVDKTLSKHAIILYVWYKRVCWEKRECYQSLKTVCSNLGMSKTTVINARNELLKNGYIVVKREKDKYDNEYVIVTIVNIWEQNEDKYTVLQSTDGYMRVPEGVHESTQYKTSLQRHTMSPPSDGDNAIVSSLPNKRKCPSPWDHRAAEELHKAVTSFRPVNGRSDLKAWAEQFRLMREYDKIEKKDIREVLQWYAKHIGEEYIPEAFSASSFRSKFKDGKFLGAMNRSRKDEGEEAPLNSRQKMLAEFKRRIWELQESTGRNHGTCDVLVKEVALVTEQMGLPPNSVKFGDF